MSNRVLVIGIDGSTWKIIDPLIKKAKQMKELTLKKYGLKQKRIIGMISRIQREKGQDTLIEAISKFKIIKDFILVFVGSGDIEQLNDLAKKLKVKDKVKFLGYINDEDK